MKIFCGVNNTPPERKKKVEFNKNVKTTVFQLEHTENSLFLDDQYLIVLYRPL